jgi:hypothetical protein
MRNEKYGTQRNYGHKATKKMICRKSPTNSRRLERK